MLPPASVLPTSAGAPVGSSPPVFSSGLVTLGVGSGGAGGHLKGSWGAANTLGEDDIVVSHTTIASGSGSAIALTGTQPSYQDCRNRNDYRGSRPWSEVSSGSYLCIKTADNRVGEVKVDYKLDQSGSVTEVVVSGLIYQPTS